MDCRVHDKTTKRRVLVKCVAVWRAGESEIINLLCQTCPPKRRNESGTFYGRRLCSRTCTRRSRWRQARLLHDRRRRATRQSFVPRHSTRRPPTTIKEALRRQMPLIIRRGERTHVGRDWLPQTSAVNQRSSVTWSFHHLSDVMSEICSLIVSSWIRDTSRIMTWNWFSPVTIYNKWSK